MVEIKQINTGTGENSHDGEGLRPAFIKVNENFEAIKNELNEKTVYIAKISQAGTNSPTAIVLKDTIGGLAWARTGVGTYTLSKVGAFTDKTVPDLDIYSDQAGNLLKLTRTSSNVMTLQTYAASNTEVLADGVLSSQFLQIEIYK